MPSTTRNSAFREGVLAGLPFLLIVTENPEASYYVKTTIVFVVAMSLLLLTFVPKFCIARSNRSHNLESTGAGSTDPSAAVIRGSKKSRGRVADC